jgi:hypothetical protein
MPRPSTIDLAFAMTSSSVSHVTYSGGLTTCPCWSTEQSRYWGISCAPLEAGALPSSQSPAPGTGPRPAMNLMWVCGAEIANLAAVIGLLSRSPVGSGLSRQAVGPVASGKRSGRITDGANATDGHASEVETILSRTQPPPSMTSLPRRHRRRHYPAGPGDQPQRESLTGCNGEAERPPEAGAPAPGAQP